MTAIPRVSSVLAMPVRPVAPPSPMHGGFEEFVDSPAAGASDAGDESLPDMPQVGEGGDPAPDGAEAEENAALQQPASAAPDTTVPALVAASAQIDRVGFADAADDGGIAFGQVRSGPAGNGPHDDPAASGAVMLSPDAGPSVPSGAGPIIEQSPRSDAVGVLSSLRAQTAQPATDLPAFLGDGPIDEPRLARFLTETTDRRPTQLASPAPMDARTAHAISSRALPAQPDAPAEAGVAIVEPPPAVSSGGIERGGNNLTVTPREWGAARVLDSGQSDIHPSSSKQLAEREPGGITGPVVPYAQVFDGEPKADNGPRLRQAESAPRPAPVQTTSNDKPGDQTHDHAAGTNEPGPGITVRMAPDRDVRPADPVAPQPEARGPTIHAATARAARLDDAAHAKSPVVRIAPRGHVADQASPAGIAMPQTGETISDSTASAPQRADLIHLPPSLAEVRFAGAHVAPEAHHAPRTPHSPGPLVEMRGGTAHATVMPDELGRIDIRVERGDGGLSILMRAERPESADLMRRNADILQRELAESGVGHARLEFSQGNAGHGNGQGHGAGGAGAGQAGLAGGGGGAGNPAPHPRTAARPGAGWAAQLAPAAADGAGRPRKASDRMDVRL